MKKFYSKGAVHPSPPPLQHHPPFPGLLDFLPAAILVLTAALTADDREVLAYLLLSCSAASSPSTFPPAAGIKHQSPTKKNFKVATAGGGRDHPPAFGCSCFGCYMSFWVRWDSSPNRELIHEIIDAFEDWDAAKNSNKGGRREKRKKGANGREARDSPKIDRVSDVGFPFGQLGSPESPQHGGEGAEGDGSGGGEMEEKGSVKKLVSFIGERMWGVWG